jgi:hypothetical protein
MRALSILLGLAFACAANAADDKVATRYASYKGKFFEVQYPANFKVRVLDAAKARESNAATFASADGSMEFYVFSPQWAGDAPGIALDGAREIEVSRDTKPGKSSGVAGTFTWTTIAAKDKSYTRRYQDFLATDGSIHWVIGMKYRGEADLARYQAEYAKFKASLKQLAD